MGAIGVLFLAQQVVPAAARVMAEAVGRRLDLEISERLLVTMCEPETIDVLEKPLVRDLVAEVIGRPGSASMRDGVTGLVNVAIVRGGALIGVVVLVPHHWWLAVLVIAGYVVAITQISSIYQAGLLSSEGSPTLLRRAGYLRDLAATSKDAKDVRVFGLLEHLRKAYSLESGRALTELRRGGRGGVVRTAASSGAIVILVQGIALWVLTADLVAGRLTAGQFTTCAVAIVGLSAALSLSPELLNLTVAGTRLAQMTQLEGEVCATSGRAARVSPRPALELRKELVFDRVTFTYPGASEPVLRDFSLTLRAGMSSAIVGPNGAGKSTLIKLLCGLYRPDSGRITVDGVDLASVGQAAWQRRCALLGQDWVRWPMTVRDNVTWGAPDMADDVVRLNDAAHRTGLDEVVEQLPQAWDTQLSRAFNGVDLSGGQWQRVGISRALFASNDDGILVLDEPTSALDVKGETELNERLLSAAEGRTVVLVSHRLAAVRHADEIHVIDCGAVVESGTHDELMTLGKLYHGMFRTQADRYALRQELS
ncbi:ABC transporter ATP-binding protein [Nocardioides zeae]|uniref:ABC-type multidrug transport system fused ATPase/permease subunit n=1 Tax=Nocardioides zeae TaxID=1457234 RepID=A0AAJ1WZL8_9ACTN|nr:ABC transporter ATP-binding protein [Nocardioides zeae]MDQ1102846.1 ABC-type multidrug transport system fused ATPase/permease subunit [Nocardioides zeae]